MSNTNESRRPWWRSGRALTIAAVAGVTGMVVGGIATTTGSVFAHGMWSSHHRGVAPSAEQAKARAAEKVEWVLGRVDADDEQKSRIVAIIHQAVDEMMPLMSTHREHRRNIVELLSAEEIDTDALERLRAAELALLESGSKVLTRSVSRAASVLSLEQRRELTEAMSRVHHQ